jgi:hypothetical protein
MAFDRFAAFRGADVKHITPMSRRMPRTSKTFAILFKPGRQPAH